MTSITENNNMTIQEMIDIMHNPDLVKPTESPNGNWIYHIYSDGEITNQKGGWAYLKRSVFVYASPILGYKCKYVFPLKSSTNSYAIVTLEDALKIRAAMIQEHTNSHL